MTKDIRIFSFQGSKGAYSEMAGKEIYPEAKSFPCKTFEEMFRAVRDNKADCAIVPIENSRAGRVADTQRLIPESKLKIIGEYFLEINHCLLSTKDSDISLIKKVRSHEQALAQCRQNILSKNIPHHISIMENENITNKIKNHINTPIPYFTFLYNPLLIVLIIKPCLFEIENYENHKIINYRNNTAELIKEFIFNNI